MRRTTTQVHGDWSAPVSDCVAQNPGPRIEQVFREIAATRMAGLPVCNPALQVAAIGFREWRGDWLGALLTPWCLNLVRLRPRAGDGEDLAIGEICWWSLPSGEYPFIGSFEDSLGAFQVCSLYSPVFEFEDQEAALAVAREALRLSLTETDDDGCARDPGYPAAIAAQRAISRRTFLRTAWLRGAR